MEFVKRIFRKHKSEKSTHVINGINQSDMEEGLPQEEPDPQEHPEYEDNEDNEDKEYEIAEIEILPQKIICPDCGGITLEGLDFCDKCGGEL